MLAQGSAISLIIDKQRDAFNKQSKYAIKVNLFYIINYIHNFLIFERLEM